MSSATLSREMRLPEVFLGAADRVRDYGLAKGWSLPGDGCQGECIVQSVMSVLGIDGRRNPVALPRLIMDALHEVLRRRAPEYRQIYWGLRRTADRRVPHSTLIRYAVQKWNDCGERDRYEVILMLEAAAVFSRNSRRHCRVSVPVDARGSAMSMPAML